MATSTRPMRATSSAPTPWPKRIAGYARLRDTSHPPRGLGRPRLRHQRRRRRLPAQGGREGTVPRLLEGARRPTSGARARASTIPASSARPACACRSSCSTCAGFARRSRRTDQRGAPGKERYLPDPDPAKTMLGADAMGLARRRTAQARRAPADRVEHPGAGRRPWLGALGQLPARAPEADRHDPRQRRQGRRAAVGRPPRRRALSRDAARPLPALRGDLERPQHGLLRQPRSPDPIAWARSMPRPISASSTSTGPDASSRSRCATKAAARGAPLILTFDELGLAR